MAPSQNDLVNTLNALVEADRVVVTETRINLAINQLNGAEADVVVKLLQADGWHDIVASDAGGEIPANLLAGSGEGVRVTAVRMPLPDGIEGALTKSGFIALLERPISSSVVWVHGLQEPVETWRVRYAPWGNLEPFTALDTIANPARVVRVLGPGGPGDQLDRWLLRDCKTQVDVDAMAPWRERATKRLLAALAQEIEPDGRLLFRGPPPTRFTPSNTDLNQAEFVAAQATTGWVYENSRELDNRHGLVAAEVARASHRDGSLADLAATLSAAHEGARIAYNFGVTQQSKDTLKALGDLRKSVSDDAAKLSETTRSLGTAIIGAVFGNIGLIIARLTLPANGAFIGPAAILIGVVLAIYVCAIIGSGVHYLSIQRDLRNDWRTRLYRFLSDDEYSEMVTRPAERAERAFRNAAIAGVAMTLLLLIAVILVASSPPASTKDEVVGPTDAASNSAPGTNTEVPSQPLELSSPSPTRSPRSE